MAQEGQTQTVGDDWIYHPPYGPAQTGGHVAAHNERSALDARTPLSLRIERHRPGESESERWASAKRVSETRQFSAYR